MFVAPCTCGRTFTTRSARTRHSNACDAVGSTERGKSLARMLSDTPTVRIGLTGGQQRALSQKAAREARGHWLLFNDQRQVVGCHCGFAADLEADCGWGDSVVEHLLTVPR